MPRRLILIDRESSLKERIVAFLPEDIELLSFTSPERAMEALKDLGAQAILIAGEAEPADVLQLLRSTEPSRDIPLLVVGEGSTPAEEAAAFEAGADGFIPRDSDAAVFKARLGGIFRQSALLERIKSKLEEMDDFVRTVAHDLKNPIASIYSCAELLALGLESEDLEEARSLGLTIRHSSEHALEFIQDLLSLMRGGTPLRDLEEVSSREVIETALEFLELKVRSSGAIIELPSEFPRITCDKRRLEQVFTNLFSNALKYVARGVTPRITVTCLDTPHANIFVVADNGIGMEARDTKRIFRSFVRLPEAQEYEGTGLGLSIVRRVVEAHEGNVFARSRKGLGSEFYVVLPKKLSFVPERELETLRSELV